MEYIAFDAHKHYTLASVARPDGQLVREQRIAHERGALQQFLERCERGSAIAKRILEPQPAPARTAVSRVRARSEKHLKCFASIAVDDRIRDTTITNEVVG